MLFPGALVAVCAGIGILQAAPTHRLPEVGNLCAALEEAQPGARIPVRLSGVVVSGPEHQIFFDPYAPECPWDLQPSTWIEFSAGSSKKAELRQLLKEDHRARVTVRGELYGPPALGPDDPALNPVAAYANRVGGRRYGHLGAFRTMIMVTEILHVEAAPTELAGRAIIRRPEQDSEPRVLEANVPHYSEMARHAGISGEVSIAVTVVDGRVTSTELLGGDRLLAIEAMSNVRTWEFSDEMDSTFTTLFIYRLERRPFGSIPAPRIELHLPWLVRVTAARDEW